MVNIVELLEPNTTKHNLDKSVARDFPRGYPGISGAGEECLRKRQFEHYFCGKGEISARTQRIFNVGHLFEDILNKELLGLGYEVWGDQTEMTLLNGRLFGHNDGFIKGIPEAPKTVHVLEIKTMNDKAFKDVCKKKVKLSKPVYYTQMQLYMKAMKLERALFIAINKNDCSYYIERVNKDSEHIKEVLNKTIDVLESEILLIRLSDKKTFFKCGWCNYKDICHSNAPIEKTCRSCIGSSFDKAVKWNCWRHDKKLDRNNQIEACEDYQIMEMFENNGFK